MGLFCYQDGSPSLFKTLTTTAISCAPGPADKLHDQRAGQELIDKPMTIHVAEFFGEDRSSHESQIESQVCIDFRLGADPDEPEADH